MRSGIAAIDTTKRDGNGVSEDEVISNLEAKLAAAKRVKARETYALSGFVHPSGIESS